ncbi:WXG100 family type VII secretion target [Cryobacterium sp. Y82]|uniref:WXG100 family type VII secretion target n=1 Tax=Cryobacterium sp. Y82 TaxID=2045017 RepID=UPI000CE4DBA1|nr:hypothetical protein [Cryobacterium sp. Y82]
MAGKYGADVEQLRQLAQQMSTASDRLERDRLTVGNQIKISAWVGPFATTFKAQWESEHSLHVATVARVLEANATQLRKNADEQEAASAADSNRVGGTGTTAQRPEATSPNITFVFPSLPADLDAASRAALNDLMALLKIGTTGASSLQDVSDIFEVLAKAKELGTLKEFLAGVKGLDGATFLSLIGMGFSAQDLGEALGQGDTGASIEASLDLAMGVVGIYVPGAGLAWTIGTGIGEGLYNSVQEFWDTPNSALWTAALEMFGPDVNLNDLSPEQAAALAERYEGFGGYLNSIGDSMRGAGRDLGDFVSNSRN